MVSEIDWTVPRSDLERLKGLERNWDYRGARAVKLEAVQLAEKFIDFAESDRIPIPYTVAPTPIGGVYLEWPSGNKVVFYPAGNIDLFVRFTVRNSLLLRKIFNVVATLMEKAE